MRLYHFNPNTYGMEAFVCAENKQKAIEALKKNTNYSKFFKKKIINMTNETDGYTIDEHDVGEVVFSELS
jgi:tellurite resistance protein